MYHSITILGNLGKDPEMKFTPSGQPVTAFSVATSNEYKNKEGEKVKETIWLRVEAWGKLAEVCNQYLAKGSKVLVVGRLKADKDTGGPRMWGDPPKASFEVTAETVRFLSPTPEKAASTEFPSDSDDLPF